MDFSTLNTLDYVVLGVVVISMFLAFIRGFVGSFLSLTGWILSIYLAYMIYPQVQPIFLEKVKNDLLVLIFGHSVLLLGFLIAFGLFNLAATVALKGLTKGIIDRMLGAGFGILRGGLIVSFVFFIATATIAVFQGNENDNDKSLDDTAPDWLKTAQTYPMMKIGKNLLQDFIPTSFYERLHTISAKVSNKSLDERFLETALDKFSNNLTDEQKQQLHSETQDDILNMSVDEAEVKKLQKMLEMLKKDDSPDGQNIPKKDLIKLENILSKKLPKKPEPVELDVEPNSGE
jgi:membrane protein required for colicin V production